MPSITFTTQNAAPEESSSPYTERLMAATAGLTYPLEVTCDSAAELTSKLDSAVRKAEQAAMKSGMHGVLLTRHTHRRFTVEVSTEVPFGQTLQSDQSIRRYESKDYS